MVSTNNQDFDQLLVTIADYVCDAELSSEVAFDTARYCLMDSIGCGILALNYDECTKLLGPLVPGMSMQHGARVPGTQFELDPVQAAFNIGAMIRWLDYNDTWLAQEWGHPSDNLGGILAVTDYLSRQKFVNNAPPISVHDVLVAMIKAHEIQGVLALENCFNRIGLDHVILVKVASTAVLTKLLGGNKIQVLNALSNAWLDGHSLRTYRHAPNTGSRKSWAAGDATARAVQLALFAMRGEMGYPSVLSAKTWGFCDVYRDGKALVLARELNSYVMENILFKIAYPAEFHGQTAVECALQLHDVVKDRLDDIDKIVLTTQEPAMRIINKTGVLNNSADRDHCLQYMVAVALIHGELTADSYQDKFASDARIDALREKMVVSEDKRFSQEYLDPDERAIGNAVQVVFQDGSKTELVSIDYPVGHRLRRAEGMPLLKEKFIKNMGTRFDADKVNKLVALFDDKKKLDTTPVDKFMEMFV